MIYWRFEHVILTWANSHLCQKRLYSCRIKKSGYSAARDSNLMLDSFDLSFGIFRFIDRILNLLLDSEEVVLQMLSLFLFYWGCIHPNIIFLILSAWAADFLKAKEPSLKDHQYFPNNLEIKLLMGLRVMVVLLWQIPNGPRCSYCHHDLV